MAKAKDAFRTISEVAEWLDTPTHVLRFWESKFTQIKPVKGAGGRRYYRPTDMDLLGGIKQLLHEDGLTIKGTQKLLREKGVKHVATLGQSMGDTVAAKAPVPDMPVPAPGPFVSEAPAPDAAPAPEPKPETAPEAVQDMFPFEDTAPAAQPEPVAAVPEIELPAFPDEFSAMPGRLVGCVPADLSDIQARAAQILPLLARLDNLRERMRDA